KAANTFIDRLPPSDRVAVAGIGAGAPGTAFTADRTRTKQAIGRMVGQKMIAMQSQHNIAVSEALAVDRGDSQTLTSVQQRECGGIAPAGGGREVCFMEVEVEVRTLARDALHEADETMVALRELFLGLRVIDAPKTLIFISEGFAVRDQTQVS